MDTLGIAELAARAGVEPAFVDRLVQLGILRPVSDGGFPESGVRRVRMVRLLEAAGIGLEGIGAMIASRQLPLELVDIGTAQRFASYADVTFEQMSARTGVPVQLLTVIREAAGSAPPEADERMREDELPIASLVQFQLALGLRGSVIERSLRVYGESLRRIAETEAGWWQTDIAAPRLADGRGWVEVARVAGEQGPELSRLTDEALLALYHAHQTHAWMRNILEGIESALSAAGFQSRPERSPPAICFLDITGYTRLTEERGDEAAAELADRLARIVQRSSSQQGGKPVKWLGDGVMFHFPDPAGGVVAALDMVDATAGAGLPPAHVGLHAGPVLFQDGDYFGRTVNVASRIAEYARPGEVVVSQAVVDLVDLPNHPGIGFREIGAVELKGVSGTIRLHAATRAR